MRLFTRSSLLLLVLAPLASETSWAQDKRVEPKVVLDLEKPAPSDNAFHSQRFGLTCRSSGDGYRVLDRPSSIVELMGAPVELIRIRRYDRRWTSPDEVRNHVIKLLQMRTGEVYRYEPWPEMVLSDIVATIQFSDKVKGTLEESGGHVCFSDHSNSVSWVRLSRPEADR
jgi:hypothetical protein